MSEFFWRVSIRFPAPGPSPVRSGSHESRGAIHGFRAEPLPTMGYREQRLALMAQNADRIEQSPRSDAAEDLNPPLQRMVGLFRGGISAHSKIDPAIQVQLAQTNSNLRRVESL